MAASIETVRNLDLGGGGFAAISDAQMQIFLTLANAQLSEAAWGDCYDMAHGLLTAHLLSEATNAASGSTGPVAGASAGGLSVSYGGGSASSAEGYKRTRYGQMLLDLWDACAGGVAAVVIGGANGCCDEPAGSLGAGQSSFTAGANSGGTISANAAAIAALEAQVQDFAPIESPTFTGAPQAPTPANGDDSTAIATTAFVMANVLGGGAPVDSPTFTGVPAAPTAAPGTNTTQLATCEFVQAAIPAPVDLAPLTSRLDALETSQAAQDTTIATLAPLAAPAFSGVPTAPTAAPGTNTTQLATTAFVLANQAAATDLGPLTTRVTALETSQGTQDTAIAAVEATANGNETDIATNTGAITALQTSQSAQDTAIGLRAPLASPALTGSPTAPTAAGTSNDTTIATTAFVKAAIPAPVDLAPLTTRVTTLEGEMDATETATATNAAAIATKAPIASPSFTGAPQAETPPPLDDSNRIVTTEWIANRAFAPINSPSFNGTPTVPTPDPNDDSAQIASTEWVQNRAYAPRESPFLIGIPMSPTPGASPNNLQIANVGWTNTQLDAKAPLASPVFTGVPSGPTAPDATNTTQLATTAFVQSILAPVKTKADDNADDIALNQAEIAINTAKVSNATHTGDVTGATALTIAPGAVTLPKLANLSGPAIIGRASGAGTPEALGVGTGLDIDSGNLRSWRSHTIERYIEYYPQTNLWVRGLQRPNRQYSDNAGTGAEPADNPWWNVMAGVEKGWVLRHVRFMWRTSGLDVGDLDCRLLFYGDPNGSSAAANQQKQSVPFASPRENDWTDTRVNFDIPLLYHGRMQFALRGDGTMAATRTITGIIVVSFDIPPF